MSRWFSSESLSRERLLALSETESDTGDMLMDSRGSEDRRKTVGEMVGYDVM